MDDGAFVLNNGMLVAIENCKGCAYGKDHNIWLVVDVNGRDYTPNKVGYDLFVFQVTKDGLLPLGAPGTDAMFSAHPENYCCDSRVNPGCSIANRSYNGYTCSYFASTDEVYNVTVHAVFTLSFRSVLRSICRPHFTFQSSMVPLSDEKLQPIL